MQTPPLILSCDDCVMSGSDACPDCVVTYLFEHDPDDAVIIEADEARALRLLARAGLTSEIRHKRLSG